METISPTTNLENRKNVTAQNNIKIKEVKTRKEIRQFLQLPRSIYRDPQSPYVMPLEMHMKMMMGKVGTPQKHFFLAYSANNPHGEPIARLGAKVHSMNGHERLHFGFFECNPQYPEAAKLLIDHAHSMYPHLEMMGPFHF